MSLKSLDEVAVAQYVWKTDTMKTVAVRICLAAIRCTSFYPDQVDLDGVPEADCNCVGTVYRVLRLLGVISKTGRFRCSASGASKHRTVFEWSLTSFRRAQRLLERNDVPLTEGLPTQEEMKL